MCLAPSQHYSKEGLLTQSGLAQRAEQVESSENRPQKKRKGHEPDRGERVTFYSFQLRIMLPLFTTQSDISNNHTQASWVRILSTALFISDLWLNMATSILFYFDKSNVIKLLHI